MRHARHHRCLLAIALLAAAGFAGCPDDAGVPSIPATGPPSLTTASAGAAGPVATAVPAADEPTDDSFRLPASAMIVDLTHAFDDQTPYWPTAPTGFVLEEVFRGTTEGGFYYTANNFAAPEHGGTHLDAPIHFAEGRDTADAVPLERLIASAVVIDMATAAAADRDALLQPTDIEAFEAKHGAIVPGTIVLVHTGWADRWPDKLQYLGDDKPGDASNLHFPGISGDAARTLRDRKVAAVGIDTASIDHGPSTDFIAHQVLMAADIPAFENVAAMKRLPPRGALVIALPMKIAGGSGGPLRIVAVVSG